MKWIKQYAEGLSIEDIMKYANKDMIKLRKKEFNNLTKYLSQYIYL